MRGQVQRLPCSSEATESSSRGENSDEEGRVYAMPFMEVEPPSTRPLEYQLGVPCGVLLAGSEQAEHTRQSGPCSLTRGRWLRNLGRNPQRIGDVTTAEPWRRSTPEPASRSCSSPKSGIYGGRIQIAQFMTPQRYGGESPLHPTVPLRWVPPPVGSIQRRLGQVFRQGWSMPLVAGFPHFWGSLLDFPLPLPGAHRSPLAAYQRSPVLAPVAGGSLRSPRPTHP